MMLHICLLDKECRAAGAPWRAHLTVGSHHYALAFSPGSKFGQRFRAGRWLDVDGGCWFLHHRSLADAPPCPDCSEARARIERPWKWQVIGFGFIAVAGAFDVVGWIALFKHWPLQWWIASLIGIAVTAGAGCFCVLGGAVRGLRELKRRQAGLR